MGSITLMAKNDFKAFATDLNANVMSQEEWEALPALLSGFTAGKASSAQVNKVIRQASFIAAALAQYTANKSGLDVLDDGDLNGFISKMGTAFGKDFQALDATLTALAGLETGANKLPYFTGNDTAAQTDLTSVGRDIIGKNTIADILTYLGLGDVNSGRLLNVQVFTSSGLYTPTPGTKKAIVEVQGAGGAGAGTNSPATMCAASGSGTSGAYAKAIIDNPTPQQVTVGSGGKGGVDNPAGNGNAGGQSSFGSLVTAIGGLGGEAMTAGTGVWSAFFSGTMPAVQFTGANIVGRGCGMPTISLRLGGVFSYSGNGGDSIFGAGGIGSRGQSRGGDGVGYGAGGAGANVNGGFAGSFTGGDGTDGVVIVWEYM
ncbi:hypothetical protein J9A09_00940 [Escherichia coli]|nr:hypothetical protein [Escherichia coli]